VELIRKGQETAIRGKVTIRKRLTPRRAIHEHCIDCIDRASAVRDCQGDQLYDGPCIFFPYRMGKRRPSVKLIRKFCLYCMNGHKSLIRNCHSKACALLLYRMGKNPAIELSEEQLQKKRDLVREARRHRIKSPERAPATTNFHQESPRGILISGIRVDACRHQIPIIFI
jgi:hypothetical protein